MAPVELEKLADELVLAFTGFEQGSIKGIALRYKVLSRLKNHNYGRTNHFEVQRKLEGLEEKFRVLDEDELAEALHSRRVELEASNVPWRPDILSLFLELSDDPVNHVTIESIKENRPQEGPPPLTWEQIIADDPLDETGVWDNIDYGAESSDNDFTQISVSSSEDEEEEAEVPLEDLTVDTDVELRPESTDRIRLEQVLKSQFWNSKTTESSSRGGNEPPVSITELQAIREILFMLSGLPSPLFSSTLEGDVASKSTYTVNGISRTTFRHILDDLTEDGSHVLRLKTWLALPQTDVLLQTLSTAIGERLLQYDVKLAQLQQKFAKLEQNTIVSTMDIKEEIQNELVPVVELAKLVAQLQPGLEDPSVRCLELLFERVSHLQAMGDEISLGMMVQLFAKCFSSYLRPINSWMAQGELIARHPFFIQQTPKDKTSLASLWQDSYQLRKDKNGNVLVPSFLTVSAERVSSAGKSVVFFKQLRTQHSHKELMSPVQSFDIPELSGSQSLIPWQELFDRQFSAYIQACRSPAVSLVPEILRSNCGLFTALESLQSIYLMKEGSVYSQISGAIFEKIDHGKSWTDRFWLTDVIQNALGSLPHVDTEGVLVRLTKPLSKDSGSVKALTILSLDYRLSWPIQNIIQRSSIPVYQSIFTLLLEILHAKHVLERYRIINAGKQPRTTDLYHLIRFKLLWFINNIHQHLTLHVLTPKVEQLNIALEKAEDVDAMVTAHITFVDKLEAACLLSKNLAPLHQSVIEILDIAMKLAELQEPNSGKAEKLPSKPTESGSNSGEDTLAKSTKSVFTSGSLQKLATSFDRHLSFVRAGVKSVSRIGEDPVWAILSERLQMEGWDSRR